MPCNDGGFGGVDSRWAADARKYEAMLCAITSWLQPDQLFDFLHGANWKEAGITQEQFVTWLQAHREKDEMRRQAETTQAAQKATAQQALEKLTPEQKKALKALGWLKVD